MRKEWPLKRWIWRRMERERERDGYLSSCSGELSRVGQRCCSPVSSCPGACTETLSIPVPRRWPPFSSRALHPATSLHLASHPPRRNPPLSLSLSRSADHFNLHYVRPRIAEGSIKFLLSRAAFSKAAKAYHQRTRHLSNGLFALSRVASNYLFRRPRIPEIVFLSS